MKFTLSLILLLLPLKAVAAQDGAIQVDNGGISFPHHSIMNTTDRFTAEAWIRSATTNPTSSIQIFSRFQDSREHKYLQITTSGAIVVMYAGSPWPGQSSSPGVFPMDTLWHHVAFVRYPGGRYQVFVDGKMVNFNRGPCWSTCAVINGNPMTNIASSSGGPWVLSELRISNTDRYWNEFIPERKWTADADTAMLLHFDAGSGTTELDFGPAAQMGTHQGGISWVMGMNPLTLSTSVLKAGGVATVRIDDATPSSRVLFVYSLSGLGSASVKGGKISTGLSKKVFCLGTTTTFSSGTAQLTFQVPLNTTGRDVFFQAIESVGGGIRRHSFIRASQVQ